MTRISMSRSRTSLALALLTLLCGPLPAAAKGPEPAKGAVQKAAKDPKDAKDTTAAKDAKAPRTEEAWFDFKFQGSKVGYLFSLDEVTSVNGRPARHAKRWSVLTVRRQDQVIRMESTTDAWSEMDGAPMRYKHVRLEGKETRGFEGYRDGNTFVVRSEVGGNVSEKKLDLGPGVYLGSALDALFGEKLAKNAALKGKAIVEEEGVIRGFTLNVTGTEKTSDGEAFVVEEDIEGIKSRELVLPDGRTLKVTVPGLGAEFTRTTRELAVREEAPVDIFTAALFSVDQPLPAGPALEELTVVLRGKSGKVPTHIADPRQRAKPRGKDAVELRIRAEDPPAKPPRLPVGAPAVQAFLAETPFESLHDEALVAAEKKVVGDEKNAWEAAKKLNAFVHRHIEKKTLSRAFATASEALATKEGDCTEHAILFSALAKIAGIPTRLITGLVYVGGPNNTFGYHEWVEVWMGDRWLPMDPTFGQDLADPTHIKFAQGLSDPDGLRNAGLVAAGLIGDLDLAVLEYTNTSGVKTKVR